MTEKSNISSILKLSNENQQLYVLDNHSIEKFSPLRRVENLKRGSKHQRIIKVGSITIMRIEVL